MAEYTGSHEEALELAGEMGCDWLPRLLDDKERRLIGRPAEHAATTG